MAQSTADRVERKRGIGGLAKQANPAFAVGAVAVPLIAFAGALASGNIRALTYVHVMAGVLWTGIDLFMGLVLGPVLGGQEPEARPALWTVMSKTKSTSEPLATVKSFVSWSFSLGSFTRTCSPTAATLIPVILLVGYRSTR